MSVQQHVLIVDDAKRFSSTLVFEPEFHVTRVDTREEALSFIASHQAIAILIINLEQSMEESLALLREVRSHAKNEKIVIGLGMDRGDLKNIVEGCESGADELIIRPMIPSVLALQLNNLRRLYDGQTLYSSRHRALQLHAVIDGISTGVAVFEYDNGSVKTLYANEAYINGMRLLLRRECTPEEDMLAYLPKAKAEAILSGLHLHLQSGEPIDFTLEVPRAPLGSVYLRLRALPIHYEGHEAPLFLADFSDVTPQHMAEKALAESNLKLDSLMNAVPGGIAVYDMTESKPKLLYNNQVLCSMTGYTAQEYTQIMENDLLKLVDARDHALVARVLQTYTLTPQPVDEVFRIITKAGTLRWVRLSATPVGQGQLCCAVYLDVTREKENEARTEQMMKELYFRAEHDALTGIINREAFYRKTAEMLQANRDCAYVIVVLDIERFKVVNDLFGKEVGDRILITIAQRMKRLLHRVGTYARMESDHFVACLPEKLLDMERVIQLVDRGLKQQRLDYHIRTCFGIYAIRNINVPVHHMCDRAMMALKTIKGNAMRRYAYYDDQLRQAMLEENTFLDEMEDALEQRQFQIYLQPIFGVDSRQPVSAEVLVRWQHPTRGLVMPGSFIPLFERNGFIAKLDHYIWERACELLASWNAIDYAMPISVNVSRIDLYNPNLCEQMLALVSQHGVSPAQLRLEITESAYAKDPEALAVSIEKLRTAGFAILMDDFGSGYSSLNVLMDMPVDALKLDMRFLAKLNTNPRAASILTSVVRMAKWLHMPVVAEGVETWDQLSFLRSIGCDHVQGYLFARPMSVQSYTAQYITESITPLEPDLPMAQGTVDLACLWNSSPQADTLFNGMIGAMGIYERSGEILEIRRVNDGYFELFGCTPQQVFEGSQEALFNVHADDRQALMDQCEHASANGRVERCVCRHIHVRDRRTTWLEARIKHLGKAGANDVFCFTFTDVTEQKEFEQSRALKNYTMILRSVYSGIFEMNLTRQTMRAIYTAGGLKPITPEERPLQALGDILGGMLSEPDEELEQLIFTDGYLRQLLRKSPNIHYWVERKVNLDAHSQHWFSFTFIRVPQTDVADEVYLLCLSDISSRKRADDLHKENQWLQLKQQEQARYQAMMEHLGTSLIELDMETCRVSHSSGFDRFAISVFDFTQLRSYKDMEPYVYQGDVSIFRSFVNNLIAHGNAAVTLRLLDQARQPIWCRVLSTFITDENGRIGRCVSAINEIDEQMKVRESLLDEQTRFQAFSDNFMVGLGVYEVFGDAQHILYLSGGYRRMVGYGEDEPLFDETQSFIGVHPDDVPRFQENTRQLLRTRQPYTIEYRVFHKDGRTLWMRSQNAIFADRPPGHTRIFAVIQDITDLKRARMDMAETLERLPVPIGVYKLTDPPAALLESRPMTTLTSLAQDGSTVPAMGADMLAHIVERHAEGSTELDEPIALVQADGMLTHARLLSVTHAMDGVLQAYCAVLPQTGGAYSDPTP